MLMQIRWAPRMALGERRQTALVILNTPSQIDVRNAKVPLIRAMFLLLRLALSV